MKTRFSKVVVIGFGKIAGDVVSHVGRLSPKYGYKLKFIEHEVNEFSRLQDLCSKQGIPYNQITDKNMITRQLLSISEPALVISAGNYYIFPRAVTEKNNLEIINFHNALLPKLPGRNVSTWAIYLGEQYSGPTWHYVNAKIDAGEIIAQKKIVLSEDIKAYELTRDIMNVAYEIFCDFFEILLERHIDGISQSKDTALRKIYYASEIPGNGVCSLDMPAVEIYRLLRAMDYGKSSIFPPVRMKLENREVQIHRYVKKPLEYCSEHQKIILNPNEQSIYLWLDDIHEVKIKYKEL